MTEIGWLKINRKTIPFHMVKGEVTLIPVPLDSCASLFPHDVEHKEIISGITTSNRKISFIGCKYNNLSLGYKAFAWSSSNMGDSTNLNYFDAIRFTGKVINVFSGPGTTFLSEESYDISKRMLSLTPKPWEQINKEYKVKIGQNEATIRVYYHITHNLKFEETSLGKAIPFFDIIFSKKVQLKSIMELYLKVYDFFVFLNFKRNIIFDEISLLNKSGNGLSTLAYVKVNNDISTLPYAGLGCSTITLPDCEEQFSNLFYNISMRRKNRIFDNFYIPESFELDKYISYETFLSCALSFESEFERIYPSKAEENQRFLAAKSLMELSAENVNGIIEKAKNDTMSSAEICNLLYSQYNKKAATYSNELPNGKARRSFNSYCEKIMRELIKIDFSLSEKFQKAIIEYSPIIEDTLQKYSIYYSLEFPSPARAGELFASFRNSIAHGTPQDFTNTHKLLFLTARCLIYAMILRQAGFEDRQISILIAKIF